MDIGKDTGADSTGFIYNIYTCGGESGVPQVQEKESSGKGKVLSHSHSTILHSQSFMSQAAGRSQVQEKCLAQSSRDERICVLALNGKHNSSVMGDRCVKPTVSSAQSERRGKERAKQETHVALWGQPGRHRDHDRLHWLHYAATDRRYSANVTNTELVGVTLIQTLGHQKEQHPERNTYKLLYQCLQTFY